MSTVDEKPPNDDYIQERRRGPDVLHQVIRVFDGEEIREGFYPGMKAPDFTSTAFQKDDYKSFTLSELRGETVVLYFYPVDFDYIAVTEMVGLAEIATEDMASVVAISTGSVLSKCAWSFVPKKDVGIEGTPFPLVEDSTGQIAGKYGMDKYKSGHTFRGIVIVDKEGLIIYRVVSDLPLGLSIEECRRVLQAQVAGITGPDWKPGDGPLSTEFSEGQATLPQAFLTMSKEGVHLDHQSLHQAERAQREMRTDVKREEMKERQAENPPNMQKAREDSGQEKNEKEGGMTGQQAAVANAKTSDPSEGSAQNNGSQNAATSTATADSPAQPNSPATGHKH